MGEVVCFRVRVLDAFLYLCRRSVVVHGGLGLGPVGFGAWGAAVAAGTGDSDWRQGSGVDDVGLLWTLSTSRFVYNVARWA